MEPVAFWDDPDLVAAEPAAGDRGQSARPRGPRPPPPLVRRRDGPPGPLAARHRPLTGPGQPNLAAARASLRPGVDHSSTTRILDAFRYQTRWV